MKDDFYKDIYNKLYRNGYSVKAPCGVKFITHLCRTLSFRNVLDVGCSAGESFAFWEQRSKRVAGVDISHVACSQGLEKGRKIKEGSICNIPFADATFDLVYSSDCVEHLTPEDVPVAVNEMLRVSKKFVAIQVSTRREKQNWKNTVDVGIDNLHLTIWSKEEWIDFFKQMKLRLVLFTYDGKNVKVVIRKWTDESLD